MAMTLGPSGTPRLYADAHFIGASPGNSANAPSPFEHFVIGANGFDAVRPFNSSLAQCAAYNYALTPQQIAYRVAAATHL